MIDNLRIVKSYIGRLSENYDTLKVHGNML